MNANQAALAPQAVSARLSPRNRALRILSIPAAIAGLLIIACLPVLAAPRSASTVVVETCNNSNHILPAGDINTDLQISGVACTVDGSVSGGNYVFRNVNIWGGGSLTFDDAKINFHAHSILVENGGTLQAGFNQPVVGPVSIWLYGSKDDGIPSITCLSSPTCGVPTNIWNSNPNVVMQKMPQMNAPCVPASNFDPTTPVGKDCFYQYEVFDQGDAPGAFFGKKVLAVSYGGILYLRGQKGIRDVEATGMAIDADPADSGTSWVRLTKTIASANAGTTTLYVDRPVPTWKGGDQIVVTSTDYLPGHSEELTIDSVSTDSTGTIITVKAPGVQFPHWGEAYDYSNFPEGVGPRDDLNRPATQASRHLENRAAVALLSRSILIESEGTQPVIADRDTSATDPHFPLTAGYYGGHTVVRDGFKEFQVQGVEFDNLGQGGEIGHYPVHFHMARKVPQPTAVPLFAGTYLADSSIHNSNTRFVTIHATQGLLVARNVGYRSIGHGFYLEDATEINNRLYSNIGIQAVAAVYSPQNPRSVPGILSQVGNSEQEIVPFHSDFDHPSIFWIMNTWNDFRYNVAVGAGTCGVCYWTLPATNSGYSVYESWDSYAAIQAPGSAAGAGSAPLMNFIGNSCSAAMTAFQATGITTPCFGVTSSDVQAAGKFQAVPNPNPTPANAYPVIADKRTNATLCDSTSQNCYTVPPCSGVSGQEGTCTPTVLDHFSTSFNWAQLNFAAVLLRGWWYLLKDSSITDVQNGGLQMVTGGGYSRSDVAQGFWNLSAHNLFVGNTQPIVGGAEDGGVPENPFASNAGPFNPYALNSVSSPACPFAPNGTLFCISPAQGIAFENAGFANSQRLLNIYDGPTFEDSDAFSDIHALNIGSLAKCRPDGNLSSGNCTSLGWMNAYNSGVLQSPVGNKPTNHCILPNAAISWKQPNGFYYPPSFDSRNLFFNTDNDNNRGVDVRHFVIDPLWMPGGFQPNVAAARQTYCSWQTNDFINFTDVDRQTELTDLDGSLTGLLSNTAGVTGPTISVNNDPISDATAPVYDPTAPSNFFNAPVVTPECGSNLSGETSTVNTSPYQYVTTAIFPACAATGACGANWGQACTSQSCYGVPLYRNFLTAPEYAEWTANHNQRPSIRMMGQGLGQRSNLTMNHGSYYLDTTIPLAVQEAPPPQGGITVTSPNVFSAGQSYYIYVLYSKPSLHQTYSMYIGTGLSQSTALATVTTGVVDPWGGADITFTPGTYHGASPDWITAKTYDSASGVLSVTIDLSQQTSVFAESTPQFCQPTSYCSVHSDGSCGCKPGSSCTEDSVCSWGTKELDCPVDGCFGFQLTMPPTFETAPVGQPIAPPAPVLFTNGDPYFAPNNVAFASAPESVAGSCYYATPPLGSAPRPVRSPHPFPIKIP
jgi:hypothetical protein